jgi:hypothetical protein
LLPPSLHLRRWDGPLRKLRKRILVSVKWSYSDDAPITGEVSLVEFLEVQRENLCIEHCEELRALKVGQSKTFGGGDLPTIKVCRVS